MLEWILGFSLQHNGFSHFLKLLLTLVQGKRFLKIVELNRV